VGNQSKRLRSRPPKVGDVTKGNWYNFWDNQLIPGPGQIPLEASLEQIPLLVKAGSILPMEEEGHLTLHLSHPQQEPVSRFSTAMPEMAMVNISGRSRSKAKLQNNRRGEWDGTRKGSFVDGR
jgi:alpha-glucosidase (family GH31 glycosyl hydrolase)